MLAAAERAASAVFSATVEAGDRRFGGDDQRWSMQPEKLGRYEIVEELGRGAMGRVFLAHDPEIDRKVAIKIIQIFAALPEHERAEARERFLREARSAGRLLHPGIVTLFDVGEADGALYLAMEYVEGTTLDHFCRAGQPAARSRWSWIWWPRRPRRWTTRTRPASFIATSSRPT